MITIFTPSFADEAGTNAQNLSVKEIVSRLDPNRFEVTMLHERAPDPRIVNRPNTHLLRWRRRGNTIRILSRLLTRVPDIYFFPREGPLDGAFVACRDRLRLRTSIVSYVVSGGLDTGPYPPARMRHITAANLVCANNRYLAQLVQTKTNIRIAGVLYDGVDRRYYYPNPKKPSADTLAVLYAGSLRPYKRVPLVIREAARFPAVQFRIAGTGEEDDSCRSLAAELSCQNVHFLGHLSQARLADEMRSADLFLFPSIVEGHPQVLLQAAATGLPIIAMQNYHPDAVIHGITGFLAATDFELSIFLEKLIADRELRDRMRSAAIQHSAQFDWDVITRQWQDIFERALVARKFTNHEAESWMS